MRKILFTTLIFLLITLSFSNCWKKKTNESNPITQIDSSESLISETEIEYMDFGDNWNVAYDSKQNLSKEAFDSLKLNSLTFLPPYEDLDFQIGRVILNTDHKKLLSVKAIASGEISEYLLGYMNNSITDSLLIAYEDNVEYYSSTSSIIKGNVVIVTTINHDYEGVKEISDTINSRYVITPELKFEEIIEE